jgi:hypothetical protein
MTMSRSEATAAAWRRPSRMVAPSPWFSAWRWTIKREIAAVFFENLMGPVRASIVHHDDGKAEVFVGQALENAAQQIADVGLFVVCRKNYDNTRNPMRRKGGPGYLWG